MRKRLYSVPSKLVSLQMPLSLLDEVEAIRVGNFTTTSDIIRRACAEGIKILKQQSRPFEESRAEGVFAERIAQADLRKMKAPGVSE